VALDAGDLVAFVLDARAFVTAGFERRRRHATDRT
jgi:hypothetical protein